MSGFIGGALWALVAPMAAGWVCVVGLGMVLFAWHLYAVQERTPRDEVGWSDRGRALVLGVPLALCGLAVIYAGANLP